MTWFFNSLNGPRVKAGSIFCAFGKEPLAIAWEFDYNKLNYYLQEVTLCT